MPGLAGWFELGREGRQRRFAIGDGIDGNCFDGDFSPKSKAYVQAVRAAFSEAVGVDGDLALSHWFSPGKSVWVGKARLGGSGFLALVGPLGGLRLGRQAFGADVNLDDGAFGDAGRVDAFDLPMAEGAGEDGDEVELVVVSRDGRGRRRDPESRSADRRPALRRGRQGRLRLRRRGSWRGREGS